MYQLTVDTSINRHHTDTAATGDGILEILHNRLSRYLPKGPVDWTITSPWGTEHLGRICFNGDKASVEQSIAHSLYGQHGIQGNLGRDLYQHHQQADPNKPGGGSGDGAEH